MKTMLFFLLITMSTLLYAQTPSTQYKKYNVTGKVVNISQIEKISGIILPTTLQGTAGVQLCTQSDWGCTYTSNAPGGVNGQSGVVRVTVPQYVDYCLLIDGLYSWGYTMLTNITNGGTPYYQIEVGDVHGGYGYIEPPNTYNDHNIGAYFDVPSSTPLTAGKYTGTVNITIQIGYTGACSAP